MLDPAMPAGAGASGDGRCHAGAFQDTGSSPVKGSGGGRARRGTTDCPFDRLKILPSLDGSPPCGTIA